MVIRNLYRIGVPIVLLEAYPPLIIDPNAVLAPAAPLEFLQSVSGWEPEVLQRFRGVQHKKLSQRSPVNLIRQPRGPLTPEETLRFGISKPLDHRSNNSA